MIDNFHYHLDKADLSKNSLFMRLGLLSDKTLKLNHLVQVTKPMAYFDKIRKGVLNIYQFFFLFKYLRRSAKYHNGIHLTKNRLHTVYFFHFNKFEEKKTKVLARLHQIKNLIGLMNLLVDFFETICVTKPS